MVFTPLCHPYNVHIKMIIIAQLCTDGRCEMATHTYMIVAIRLAAYTEQGATSMQCIVIVHLTSFCGHLRTHCVPYARPKYHMQICTSSPFNCVIIFLSLRATNHINAYAYAIRITLSTPKDDINVNRLLRSPKKNDSRNANFNLSSTEYISM